MNYLHFARLATAFMMTTVSAHAQLSNDAAHNQGLSLGQSELDRVNTDNINQTNAQQLVPFSKEQPVQKNDTRTDANLFFDMGVTQINSSKNYTPGNCDREGFNSEAEARKGIGEGKWSQMTAAQKAEAIKNQQSFFDQECEGINFLAGQYPGRTKHEIQPGDDLGNWNPDKLPPDVPGACDTNTINMPATYDKFYCNESTSVEKRQCFDQANVTATLVNGLMDVPFRQTIINENSPKFDLEVIASAGIVRVTSTRFASGFGCWEDDGGSGCGTVYGQYRGGTAGGSPTSQTHTISLYGGQTPVAGNRCSDYYSNFRTVDADGDGTFEEFSYDVVTQCIEQFVVTASQIDACTFRFNNYHIGGGIGAPDVHMYWQYNFCVPKRSVQVTWSNNCGALDAAANR